MFKIDSAISYYILLSKDVHYWQKDAEKYLKLSDDRRKIINNKIIEIYNCGDNWDTRQNITQKVNKKQQWKTTYTIKRNNWWKSPNNYKYERMLALVAHKHECISTPEIKKCINYHIYEKTD